MRILYLTDGFPYPLTSGYLRHYFFIKDLSQRHRITLLSIVGPKFAADNTTALSEFTERILTFASETRSASTKRKAIGRIRSLAGAEHADKAIIQMRDVIETITRRQSFDLVLVSGKRIFPAVLGIKHLPLIADIYDATSTMIRGRMRHSSPAR